MNNTVIGSLLFIGSSISYHVTMSHFSKKSSRSKNVVTVALTGGPCGGKSSSLESIKSEFTAMGWHVYLIPEIPSLMMINGSVYPGENPDRRSELITFETSMLKLQMAFEESFMHIANSSSEKSLIICDRGAVDVAVYLPQSLWDSILTAIGVDIQMLLSRYDIVCHLTTAADGALKFYTTANNAARRETAEQAVELDKITRHVWDGHHCRMIATNEYGSFVQKIKAATDFIVEKSNKLVK